MCVQLRFNVPSDGEHLGTGIFKPTAFTLSPDMPVHCKRDQQAAEARHSRAGLDPSWNVPQSGCT